MAPADGMQTQVYGVPAPGVEGDWASTNPRFYALSGPGGFVAGAAGVRVAYFCWSQAGPLDPDNAPQVVNSFGTGPVLGLVHREAQALITGFLASSTMVIPQGLPLAGVVAGGDMWVKNNGATQALIGQKAYANFGTGAASFAAAGAPLTAAFTGSVAAGTFSCTGSIAGNVLTATAGTVQVGGLITVGAATGTMVAAQISGTPGGAGTYYLSIGEQSVASGTTISGTFGTLTVASGLTGVVGVGGVLVTSEADQAAGTFITALGTGAGGLGTYILNFTQTLDSDTMTTTTNVETKWIAMSSGAAGEIVKVSSHPLG